MNQENTWRHLLDKLSNHHDVVKQQHEGKILYLYTVDLYFARREICDTYYILDLFISIISENVVDETGNHNKRLQGYV